jgi:hypothetical protein
MAAVDEVLAALEQAPQGDEDAKIEALKGLTVRGARHPCPAP